MSSQDELDKDREVIAGVTPGPWRLRRNAHPTTDGRDWGWIERNDDVHIGATWSSGTQAERDCAFIARARTRYPELVEEVTRLRDILSQRDELPTVCPVCADAGREPPRVRWDGHTLYCPKCGADAMESQ